MSRLNDYHGMDMDEHLRHIDTDIDVIDARIKTILWTIGLGITVVTTLLGTILFHLISH